MDRILEGLAARAALRSGWPRLVVIASDEARLLDARARLEEAVGAVPQADEIEPWSPSDPWELRVDLPDLSAEAATSVASHLRIPGITVAWRTADPPHVTEALDRGLLVADPLGSGVVFRGLVDPLGRSVAPDLFRAATLPTELAGVESDLVAALHRLDRTLIPTTDRGPGTVCAVVHRPTGRVGVEVDLSSRPDRHRIAEALGQVVRARAHDPDVQLAPWGSVSSRLDRDRFLLYLVAPPVAPLPGGTPVGPDDLAIWPSADLVEDLEVQVVPRSARVHLAVIDRLAPLAARAGWIGGVPRWLEGPDGITFCPTWRIGPDQRDPLAQIPAIEGVAAVRVVPGEPSGLAEAWPTLAPAWRRHGQRWFVRYRDASLDRDRLERIEPVPAEARDHAVADQLPGDVRAVCDRRGRRGLEVQIPDRSGQAPALIPILDAAGAIDHPDLLSTGTWGHPRDGARVRLWFRGEVRSGPRVWRDQPRSP